MQGSETLRQLWENMQDQGVVVWFDNCYKPCHIYNLLGMRASMNTTAISVFAIRSIPLAPEWYTVPRLRTPPSLHTLDVFTATHFLKFS